MGALREMIENKEAIFKWISTDKPLADVLTKVGACKLTLLLVLSDMKLLDLKKENWRNVLFV